MSEEHSETEDLSQVAPNRDQFEELPEAERRLWDGFAKWDTVFFPMFLGLELLDVRRGYGRMRLRYRPEINQPLGVVHGGAIAGLIDTVVVPAIGSTYPDNGGLVTIDMQIQYTSALRGQDAIAEGWVVKAGRSICFCRSEVRAPDGDLIATGTLAYKVLSER